MKIFKLTLTTIALLTLVSCNSDKKQILKAAEGYLDATGNYRIEEAYPYATKETRETTLKFMSEIIMPLTDTNYIKSNSPAEIKIDSILRDTDTAWVFYTKTTPLKTLTNSICLIREEGQWLVDVPLSIPETITESSSDITTDTTQHEPGEMLPFEKAKE